MPEGSPNQDRPYVPRIDALEILAHNFEASRQNFLRAMARIRKIEINNFRSIRHLSWLPSPGINCLIGPGDSGKSSVLDAIDLCLGARRNVQFTDADFHMLDVEAVTIGELDDALKSIEGYGLYLRGFDPQTGNRAGFGLIARLYYAHASRLFNCAAERG